MQRRTRRSSAGATPTPDAEMSGGSSWMIAFSVSTADSPAKARRPESIS
jgi:hypothetical protein